jgi:hypothetical protein
MTWHPFLTEAALIGVIVAASFLSWEKSFFISVLKFSFFSETNDWMKVFFPSSDCYP